MFGNPGLQHTGVFLLIALGGCGFLIGIIFLGDNNQVPQKDLNIQSKSKITPCSLTTERIKHHQKFRCFSPLLEVYSFFSQAFFLKAEGHRVFNVHELHLEPTGRHTVCPNPTSSLLIVPLLWWSHYFVEHAMPTICPLAAILAKLPLFPLGSWCSSPTPVDCKYDVHAHLLLFQLV